MSAPSPSLARLAFLLRVAGKELALLEATDARLFATPLTDDRLRALTADADGAERLDAFVSRFGRLQDTLGDKLLPAVLDGLGEPLGAVIDNLDRAEKLGLVPSADRWLVARRLRNHMVHDYVEDMALLASALRAAHEHIPELRAAAERLGHAGQRLLARAGAAG